MRELTQRQQQVLDLIRDHIDATGFPPTRAEIASQLGFRSANAAEEHLKALARKGVIELTSGTSRGIRLKLLPSPPHLSPQAGAATAPALTGAATRRGADALANAVRVALTLPLVGRVAAGSPILAEAHVEASFAVDPDLFGTRPDYLLKVRGLSMRDAGILDGDLLAVRRSNEARNGQIVVARVGSEVTVKRLRRPAGRHVIELLPENPDFEPIVIDSRSDDFAIEGIGVGLIRPGGGL